MKSQKRKAQQKQTLTDLEQIEEPLMTVIRKRLKAIPVSLRKTL